MDNQTAVKLYNWIKASQLQSSSKYIPGDGYFLNPIEIDGYQSLTQFIKFKKIESNPSERPSEFNDYIIPKFINFQKLIQLEDNCCLLAALESIITRTDYGLILNRVKTSLAALKLLFTLSSELKTTVQIFLEPNQSILEVLETVLVPNLTLAKQFVFFIPEKNADTYAALWLIADIFEKSNLPGINVKLQDDPLVASDFLPIVAAKKSTYPPTLAIIFDDADIFSSVDRLLDMLSSLSMVHRKVDIWVQQSVRSKFIEKFQAKIKSEKFKCFNKYLQTAAINPILIPVDNPDDIYIKLLTFRKVDELIAIIKRYRAIRAISIWTSNISSAYEVSKEITNCQLFTINTINDCPTVGTQTFFNQSKVDYKSVGDGFTFQSNLSMDSFKASLDDITWSKIPSKGNKDFLSLAIEDRFNVLFSLVSKTETLIYHGFYILEKSLHYPSNFKTINKYLMLNEVLPVGIVSVHFEEILPDNYCKAIGTIGAILLAGNFCLVVCPKMPDPVLQFCNQFNAVYPSSILVTTCSKPVIPYGWIKNDCDVVGLSYPHVLATLLYQPLHYPNELYWQTRTLFIIVADQLSLTTSAISGY